MKGDAITLGDMAGKFAVLEVACRRCDRRSKLRIDRLIEQHGDMRLPELHYILASDCPHAESVSIGERCNVCYPQLRPEGL
jgi:hypothetical protein